MTACAWDVEDADTQPMATAGVFLSRVDEARSGTQVPEIPLPQRVEARLLLSETLGNAIDVGRKCGAGGWAIWEDVRGICRRAYRDELSANDKALLLQLHKMAEDFAPSSYAKEFRARGLRRFVCVALVQLDAALGGGQ